MVLLASKLSRKVFELFNDKAEPVGEIRSPRQPAMIGVGRGTVYLDRPAPVLRQEDHA